VAIVDILVNFSYCVRWPFKLLA